MRNMKLDWIEEETLAGIFYRAWAEHVEGDFSDREATPSELRRWMDLGERKIIAALKRIRAKQMAREREHDRRWKARKAGSVRGTP